MQARFCNLSGMHLGMHLLDNETGLRASALNSSSKMEQVTIRLRCALQRHPASRESVPAPILDYDPALVRSSSVQLNQSTHELHVCLHLYSVGLTPVTLTRVAT